MYLLLILLGWKAHDMVNTYNQFKDEALSLFQIILVNHLFRRV